MMTLKPHLILVTRDAASRGISLLQLVGLAHLCLHNMADILQKKFSNAFSNGKYNILIEILLKFIPEVPIDKKLAMVQMMALAPNRWHPICWYLITTMALYYMYYLNRW